MKRRDFLKSACSILVAVAATDVTAVARRTVPFHGHRRDRKMLELLQEF